jgi:steroid delta-isomerase-like uncharacterized protein
MFALLHRERPEDAILGEEAMDDTKNITALERLLVEWATAWSTGNIEHLLLLFTDDVLYEDVTFGATNTGREALRNFANAALAAFPGMTFELTSQLVADDGGSGAFEWIWRGKQVMDFPGLPATNTPFEIRGASVVQFRDTKISRCSDYWDLATYKTQVGLAR